MKKILLSVLIALGVVSLSACSKKEGPNTVSVGTMAGPGTELMEVAKLVALKQYGLHVKIVTFTDYSMPNQALADGNIDVNAFQHLPFLKAQIKAHGYPLVSVGKTFLYPMALYSNKVKSLSALKVGAKIAIPNDPSNEARALLLLQKAKLIALKPHVTINATPVDIVKNPKHFKFVALDAAQLPRALSDVSLAAINTNYAIPAGLSPSKNGLFAEGKDSLYVNIFVARKNDQHEKKIQELIESFQSKPVLLEAKKLFGDGAVPGFRVDKGFVE